MRQKGAGSARRRVARSCAVLAIAGVAVFLPMRAAAAAGDLDPSFGSGGVVVSDFGSDTYASGETLALQADGKLVVAGTSAVRPDLSDFDLALARYNTDGSLDTSFGTGGRVTTDFGTPHDDAIAITVQPDGKIVVAGFVHPSDAGEELLVARYEAGGSLDSTFGDGGSFIMADPGDWDEADDLTIQPDGKIVLAGWQTRGDALNTVYGASNFLVLRLESNGSLDTSFGSNGRTIVDFGPGTEDAGVGVALAGGGKIVVAGSSNPDTSSPADFALIELGSDGTLDSSFGVGGLVRADLGSWDGAYRVAVNGDGKILASGGSEPNPALLQLNADGSRDTSFGTSGVVLASPGGNGIFYQARYANDGKIVAAGYGGSSPSGFLVARYRADGSPDSTFGSNGVVTTALTPSGSNAFGVELQPDGNIVLGGTAFTNDLYGGYPTFGLARYLGTTPTPPVPTIHVDGTGIVDASGNPLVLRGVNRSGSEYMCAQGRGIFDGPTDAAAVAAITSWNVNAVRIPLNEDCWLGINGVDASFAGANYQAAIAGFVQRLEGAGLVPILELHWSAPGETLALGQSPMPDQDHTVDFWRSVADMFKGDGQVVFDLFNEPFPDNNSRSDAAWTCWRDGGTCSGVSFTAAGMQELVDTVRSAGARNLILLGGPQYANALDKWLAYAPSDTLGNIAASWHIYPYNPCNATACWDGDAASLRTYVPLVATEIGSQPTPSGCDRDFPVAAMLWLDAHATGYLGWTWDAWGNCDSLIGDYGGTPSARYGRAVHDHLLGIPQPPTHVVAAAGPGDAAVSWVAPLDAGTAPISSYTVTRTPGGTTTTVPGDQTSVTVTGLANGTAYTFTVSAANGHGAGAASDSSAPITPNATYPPPAAASGVASTTSPTTVTTSSDPAATGGAATSVTVPPGTSGGSVSIAQTGTTVASPSGYLLGGVQIDVTAPVASAASPLVLVFTTTPPAGQPLDATTLGATAIYRTEGGGPPTLIGDCSGGPGQAVPDPCVASRQYVIVGGVTYIRMTVLSSTASLWNSARPKAGAAAVSDGGYVPSLVRVQPGASVVWTWSGKKAHSVTDNSGLGPAGSPWFDSGSKSSGTYTFRFAAAGTYPYRSTVKGDSAAGSVVVPVVATPTHGAADTAFSIGWSTNSISGYVFDVQYRFKAPGAKQWSGWTRWKNGVTAGSATFTPPSGNGTYAFQARLRNASTGRASGFSGDTTITAP